MNVNEKIALKETVVDVSKTVAGGILGAGAVLVSIRTAQVVGLTGDQIVAGLLIVGTFLFMGFGIREMYRSKLSNLEHLERMRQIEAQAKAERINRDRDYDYLKSRVNG